MSIVVDFRDAVVVFNGFPALAEASIEVQRGEIVLLQGPNGAGKTTLLRSIAGVLRVTDGELLVDDIRVGRETRFKTAYIPASLSFYDSLSLGDAIKLHG